MPWQLPRRQGARANERGPARRGPHTVARRWRLTLILRYKPPGNGPVAQGIEQQPSKLKVAGSNPAGVATSVQNWALQNPRFLRLRRRQACEAARFSIPVETRKYSAARTAAAMVMPPLTVSKQLVEQIAEPRFEHVDLSFGHRHVLRPVIRHRPRHPIALCPSSAMTRGRRCIVVDVVGWIAYRRMSLPRSLRGSHGATVASMADPLNDRCPRHATLWRCDPHFV
jgi:hypothetical protein